MNEVEWVASRLSRMPIASGESGSGFDPVPVAVLQDGRLLDLDGRAVEVG